ncbi:MULTISPECIES: aKG-HExxH-type peptide beta-hydroxylase [Streptomyces]|uniref:HEXXH motif-containing putative peptide modification protein n=1 Tax=Streptomyces heilongjiangensis TaxID=945052 RepID=A0ABW1B7L8_9ACTN|nr:MULTISPECIES: HEXXH motif-containing putative peptide modification protein [Streptomyces]MDC2950129.1 HEXXH motif-containing putative peptide modification protein [Streptomyces heilongjiangensis]
MTRADTIEAAASVTSLQAALTARLVEHRAERARTLLASLRRLAPDTQLDEPDGAPDAFDNAVLHHAFQQARLAARTRDADRARRAVRLWQDRAALRAEAVRTAVGPVLVLRAADCDAVDDDRLGSRMYLLGDSPEQDAAERARIARTLNEAVDAALAVGGEVLRSSTAVVIWTEAVPLGATCRSYTFDFLPGTVVLNWTDEPLRLGETLVHEATHSWLNESFGAEDVSFADDGPLFHSPWKNEDRPVFGIVHAALAFANVIHYLSRIQPAPDDDSRLAAVLRRRLEVERESLEAGHAAALTCFDQVPSEPLRAYLRAAVADARRAG